MIPQSTHVLGTMDESRSNTHIFYPFLYTHDMVVSCFVCLSILNELLFTILGKNESFFLLLLFYATGGVEGKFVGR